MVQGFYAVTFRGAAAWGIGMVILHDGWITGADVGGVLIDGSYVDQGDQLAITVRSRIPPGVSLVQGVPGQPAWSSGEFSAVVPKQALDNGEPVLLNASAGPVNVIFRRVREILSRE